MTLKEFLKTLPPDEDIKIGMKDGSSFVYVGPISDLSINVLTRWCRQAILTAAENADKRVKEVLRGMPAPLREYVLKQTAAGIKAKPPRDISATAAKMVEAYNRAVRNQADAHAHVETFAPVGQRQVIDVFRAYEKPHPTVVMVEGYEIGKYTLVSEYITREERDRIKNRENIRKWREIHPDAEKRYRLKKAMEAYGYGQEGTQGSAKGPADTK